ncbi:LysM peptidoglycan-binding domain-containing protein [Janibacter sp. GS2]|uniref:LysM peptidoglycan-binding domain-containing protein n=1 Tax=Janibacter sp. GS2 TaxID=3442646 RepID=UPI003EC12C50
MTRSRTVLGFLALPGGAALTMALADGGLVLLRVSTTPGSDPAGAVAGLAAVLGSLIAAWLTLCLALVVAAELPGAVGETARRARDRITPVVVRRWAAIVLGASVTATFVPGTAVSAVRVSTDPAPGPGFSTSRPPPTTLPAAGFASAPGATSLPSPPGASPPGPGWVPRRPITRERTDPHLLTGRQRAVGDEQAVAVRRGDTLWSLAAASLGPDATDAEIARAWPRWHAANASVIGQDPDHLLPGTLLTPPSPD